MSRLNKPFFIIFLLSFFSIAYALYAEYYLYMMPCPLCIAQRVIIALIGLLALIYSIHNPKYWLKYVYNLVIAGLSIFTIKIAAHHIWLMNLPPEEQPLSCGMPLSELYKRIPLNSFIHRVLQGDAECGKVNWNILGMNAPIAVIVLCSIFLLLVIYNLFMARK